METRDIAESRIQAHGSEYHENFVMITTYVDYLRLLP